MVRDVGAGLLCAVVLMQRPGCGVMGLVAAEVGFPFPPLENKGKRIPGVRFSEHLPALTFRQTKCVPCCIFPTSPSRVEGVCRLMIPLKLVVAASPWAGHDPEWACRGVVPPGFSVWSDLYSLAL